MEKISWKAYEHKKIEKTADWYWAVIIIALSIAIIAFIINDGFFAILILVGTITLVFFSTREPRLFDISLDPRGLVVGRDMYPFATLEEFWVDITDKDEPKILFKSKKTVMPLVVVPIEQYHHLYVRNFLLQYLPEKELHEPLSQKVMEKLGF
jgi:hypothetical protein